MVGGTFNGAPATLPVLPRPAPRTLLWHSPFSQGFFEGATEGWVCSLAGRGTLRGEWQPTAPDTCVAPSCVALCSGSGAFSVTHLRGSLYPVLVTHLSCVHRLTVATAEYPAPPAITNTVHAVASSTDALTLLP